MEENKRYIPWINYAKVFGIFLVIYGHDGLSGSLVTFIYSFHMPLFFIISGILYKPQGIKTMLKKDFKSLIIPYFSLNIICLLNKIFHSLSTITLDQIQSHFIAILLGLGYNSNGFIPVSTPCWFIYSLFLGRLCFAFIPNNKKNIYIISLISIIFTCILQTYSIDLLIPIDSTFIAIPFISIGYLYKEKIKNLVQAENKLSYLFTFIVFLFWIALVKYNGRADIDTCLIGKNILIFYLNGLLGCYLLFRISYLLSISAIIDKYIKGYIKNISNQTLLIVGFNLIAISYVKKIIEIITGVNVQIYSSGLLGLLIAIIVFLIFIPVGKFVTIYMPFLIGYRK